MPRVWNRPVPFHRQAYAAIDLGTNNCRLLIARPAGEHFVVIDAFSRVVRLGEGLAQSGRLSDAAMDRALTALHVCAKSCAQCPSGAEACRRASNGAEFCPLWRPSVSTSSRRRLAVLGCHLLLEHGEGPAMIFDIGGGSTEMVLVDPSEPVPRILDWQSVPWGSSRSPKARAPSPTAPRRARRPMRTCANAWPAALPRSPSASARPARAPSSAAPIRRWARAAVMRLASL
jgi:exopolyphosphatase/guanosine-5'-triphosphate,3'-diphosphate pyrophosphatase